MALPSISDLSGMDYAFDGQPFVQGAGNSVIDLQTMDFALDAQPFVANDFNASFQDTESYTVTTSLSTIKAISKTLQYVANTTFTPDLSPSNITFPVTTTFSSIKNVAKTFNYTITTASSVVTGNLHEYSVTTSLSTIKQVNLTKTYNASTTLVPTLSSHQTFDSSFTCRLAVLQTDDFSFTSRLGVLAAIDNSFSTQLGVMEYNLAAVTAVCSVSNPFQPSIIVNGSYVTPVSSAIITNPADYCLFINMQNFGITGMDVCKLHNFGFTLDNNGGSWFITSPEALYDCFDPVTIFGFDGVVTGKGVEIESNGAGFSFSGNFATDELNQNMEYLFYGNPVFSELLSDQNLTPADKSAWATAFSAAQQIAARAGASLQWLIPDQPLPGFKPQEGSNAISALASLAQQAGGVLRWNGTTKFKVVYPDFFEGVWTIPSCDLILSPVKCETFCDLARGRSLSRSNIAFTPGMTNSSLPITDAGKKNLPGNPGSRPQVQLLTKISKRLTDQDPPMVFDLPYNYKDVYIQTLVPANGSTGGNNLVSIQNYVTKDEQEYFELKLDELGSSYIFVTNIGGVQQPQLKFDYKLLTVEGSNTSIDNGNFVTSLYYTTNELQAPDTEDEVQSRANLTGQLRYSFYKTDTCTFSTAFFGSLPLPGMKVDGLIPDVKLYIPDCLGGYTTQVIGDIVLDGIVDSVSFAFPGTVSITASNYRRLLRYNTSGRDGNIPGA